MSEEKPRRSSGFGTISRTACRPFEVGLCRRDRSFNAVGRDHEFAGPVRGLRRRAAPPSHAAKLLADVGVAQRVDGRKVVDTFGEVPGQPAYPTDCRSQ